MEDTSAAGEGNPLSDAALVESVRAGDHAAFATLWTRHSTAALRAARQFSSTADPDDLVAEAYTRIFAAIREGKGPSGAFRPYLFVTIRNLSARIARSSREETVEDLEAVFPIETTADPAIAALDRTLTVRAFRSLPERWQTVLWYTAVEGLTPLEASGLLGLSANSTAALALRARSGLRRAWIQAHVNDDSSSPECTWMLGQMARFANDELAKRDRKRAMAHLAGCAKCLIVSEEVDEVSSHLAMIVIPLVLGSAAGAGYLASVHGAASVSVQASAASASSVSPSAAGTVVGASSGGATGWLVGAGVAVVVTAAASWGIITTTDYHPLRQDAVSPTRASEPQTPEPTPSSPEHPPVIPDPAPIVRDPPEQRPSPATVPVVYLPAPMIVERPVIATPADGALLALATPTVSGTGIPGDTIRLLVDGASLGQTVVSGSGQWTLTPLRPLTDGVHRLSAQQSGVGPGSAPTVVRVTVDTVVLPPSVATVPDSASLLAPSLDGTAEPGARITVKDPDGATVGSATAEGDGRWSTGSMTALDPASTSLSVSQIDPAGNASSATVIGPLAFHPALLAPTSPAEAEVGIPLEFQLAGWAGRRVVITLDGDVYPGDWTFTAAGQQTRYLTLGSIGDHVLTIRYAGADLSTAVQFVVSGT